MKKLLYSITALSLVTVATCPAMAVDTPKPATSAATSKKDFTNVKIAVVDIYAVFDKSKEGADLQQSIKADMEKRIANIQAMESEKQKIESELSGAGANVLSGEAREKRQKKLLSLKNEIMIEQQAAQEIPQQRAQMAQMDMLKKIETTTQKIAKNLGIDVVLAGSTIFVADRIDITQMIVDELNSNYKPAVKPAAKPATPAKS
ncbi:MAG: OmpH family outer membrane protein [Candidatus Babeliales bacterium]